MPSHVCVSIFWCCLVCYVRLWLFIVYSCTKGEMIWWCRSVSKVHDAWFADEDLVRKTVGLLEKPVFQNPNPREVWELDFLVSCSLGSIYVKLISQFPPSCQFTCGICFENYPRARIKTASCGHPYCFSCWAGITCVLYLLILHPKASTPMLGPNPCII